MKLVLFTFLISFNHITYAQIFKCKSTNGKITYSESPCPSSSKESLLVIEENVIDSSEIRKQVQSQKSQQINTTSSNSIIDNDIRYMSSYDKETRINQLKVQMMDTSFQEKVTDARNEQSVLNSTRPKLLSYDMEKTRSNLKVDLTHRDPSKRRAALSSLSQLYNSYR
jgi:ribosomal protein L29